MIRTAIRAERFFYSQSGSRRGERMFAAPAADKALTCATSVSRSFGKYVSAIRAVAFISKRDRPSISLIPRNPSCSKIQNRGVVDGGVGWGWGGDALSKSRASTGSVQITAPSCDPSETSPPSLLPKERFVGLGG